MERRRSLVFPREHGAWGIVLIPLLTGSIAGFAGGGRSWQLLPLSIAAVSLFWLRAPAEIWLGTAAVRTHTPAEARSVRKAVFVLAGISVGALVWLFWGGVHRALPWIGSAAGGAFLMQLAIKRMWRRGRMAAQMIGAAGLTATAPAAFYVVTGSLDRTGWILWFANFLFALNQIHFVQLRIHAARAVKPEEKLAEGRGFLIGQAILIAILLAGCLSRFFSWYLTLAFLPVLWRGFAWFAGASKPLAIHALGWRELVHASLFGVLLVIAIELT